MDLEPDSDLNVTISDFIGIYDNVVPEDFCQKMMEIGDTSHLVSPRHTFGIQDRQLVLDSSHNAAVGALYANALEPCLLNYISAFPYLSSFNYVSSAALLQITEPRGGGYHMFHAENTDWNVHDRVLAWMIYLNDVDAGETEYLYQGIRVKPKAGRVVICLQVLLIYIEVILLRIENTSSLDGGRVLMDFESLILLVLRKILR